MSTISTKPYWVATRDITVNGITITKGDIISVDSIHVNRPYISLIQSNDVYTVLREFVETYVTFKFVSGPIGYSIMLTGPLTDYFKPIENERAIKLLYVKED
jgi:hypothetical protein